MSELLGFAEIAMTFSNPSPVGSTPTIVFMVDPTDDTDIEALADTAQGVLETAFTDHVFADYLPARMTIRTAAQEAVRNLDLGDGDGGAIARPDTAVLIRKLTGLAGRNHRGRIYFPGMLADTDVDNSGGLSSGLVSALQTIFTDFLTALATASMPMVLGHADDSDPTPVTALLVEALTATQRRRLR